MDNNRNEILDSKGFRFMNTLDSLLIFLGLFIIILFFQEVTLNRYLLSLYNFKNNIFAYLNRVFDIPLQYKAGFDIDSVLAVYGGVDGLNILPVDFKVFFAEVLCFFELLFNILNYKDFIVFLLPYLSLISKILLLCLPLIILLYFLLRRHFELHEEEIFEDTKPLKIFKKIKSKFLDPIYKFIKHIILSFIHSKYFKIMIWLILAALNCYSIIIDFVGWYFYFVCSFSFINTWNLIVINLIDLAPILLNIPRIVYVTAAYLIFDLIRCKKAKKKLQHFLNYIFGFIKNTLGVYTRVHGGPGTGKTLLTSDLHVASEQLLKTDCEDIFYEIRTQFPEFPYLNLERFIDDAREQKLVHNHYQVKRIIYSVIYDYLDGKTNNLFGYLPGDDFEFNNGIFLENLFDCILDYSQVYYFYSTRDPLSVANYSIRHDCKLVTYGYGKQWLYNSLFADPISVRYSSYCKIMNFDYFRAFKKVNENESTVFMYDACIASWTEIDKERGNQFTYRSLKFDDSLANQVNDGFNSYLKLGRHDSTVRFRLFFRGFYETQREGSTNSDLNEIAETAIYIRKSEKGFESSLFMWWIEPIICDAYLSWYRKIDSTYRLNRGKNSLIIYIIRSIANLLYTYKTRRNNQYDYKVMNLLVDNGVEKIEQKYPLMKCRAFRKRYASDCYSGFFEDKYLKSDKGFDDLESYSDIYPSAADYNKQNSYMIRDFNGMGATPYGPSSDDTYEY